MAIGWYPNSTALICFALSWLVFLLALYAWRRAGTVDASPALLLLGDALWLFGCGAAAAIPDRAAHLSWLKFQFLGVGILLVGLQTFTLSYSRYQRWLTKRNLLWIVGPPLLGLLLAWTNDVQGLVWAATPPPVSQDGWLSAGVRFGPLAWVYADGVLLLCIFALARKYAAARPLLRIQIGILIAGLLVALLASGLSLSGYSPSPWLDPTLAGFTAAALLFFWSVMSSRFRRFGRIPRDQVVEAMPDAVIILDLRDRVIDLNSAALKYIGKPRNQVLGFSLQQLVPHEVEELRKYQNVWKTQGQIRIGPPEAPLLFTMSITPLFDWRDKLYGRMCILRDTSELQKRELALQEAKNHLEELNLRLVSEMVFRESAQKQILEQQRVLAAMEERERLARDLHDNLGQTLGFFNMQAEASRQYLRDQDLSSVDSQLTLIAEVAQDSQKQLRDTIHDLRSHTPTERRFFPSLARQLAHFEHDHGIHVIQEIDPAVIQRGFDGIVSTQLLNILQEAQNNVAHHAAATSVRLTITAAAEGRMAEILFADDGKGFRPQESQDENAHYGLLFMRERAQLAGWQLILQSEPGSGTRILIQVPMRDIVRGESQ